MFLFLLLLVTSVESRKFPDCKKKFECLTIESCKNPSDLAKLIRIDGDTDIAANCQVLFQLHSYSTKHIHISIESFDSNVKHIELKSKVAGTPPESVYSCKREGTSAVAWSANGFIKNIESRLSSLKCVFTVTTTDKDTPFEPGFVFGGIVLVEIDGIPKEDNEYANLAYKRFCNPKSLLTPSYSQIDEFETDKSYTKMEYDFGTISCKNEDIYKTIEFRKEANYEIVKGITCERGITPKFKITFENGVTETISADDELEARCVADARYFCDYKPAVKPGLTEGQTELKVDLPNIEITPKKLGNVKCPDKYNFLVIAGRKPQKDFEIKCKNHGGNMRWTVNDTVLHKTGPFVHCVKNVDCHIMNKIPRENLIGSHLDDKFNPACHQGGTLKIKQGSANEIKVESVKCDANTGEYKYVNDGEEYSVAPGSIFTCTYDDPNKENEEENAATMKMTGVTVFLVVFFVVAAIAGIVLFFRWRQLKQMEKQLKMSSAIDEKRFAMKEEESGQTKKENGDLLANDFLSCKKREESTKFKTYDKYDKLESKKVRKEEDVFPILMENDKNRGLRKVEKLPMEKNETILHHEQAADAAAAKRKEKEDGEKEGAKTDSKKNV